MSAQERIETIFAAAIDIDDEAARRALVERACGGDLELRGRVEELLADHANAGSFLEGAAATVSDLLKSDAFSAEVPGTVIGRYKLLERIGEGGMGVVFMAQQEQPVRRKVALKVIKTGMDTRQVVARFEAERQALALMDHPNIAKVLDGGSTAGGRPYFVMELVQGSPITEYCDRNQLTARERLALFVPVCQAVQHAHTKGIIHRDLKPGNVLVTLADGVPVPKVIDFGVAKAAGQALTEATLFTQLAQMVGTPLYMSPEQAGSGQDVDTRSDVYSLGVLLYELLTGTTPFDKGRLGKAALEEVRRIIREEEPPKPSTRISTMGGALAGVSADRKIDAKKLGRLVRGELDWVVMRALEKDRARRYETANGLGKDVQRYLADEPVEASPPRTLYRLRKFARRNRRGLATAGVVMIAVMLTVGALGWSARDRSVRRAALAQEIVSSLNEAETAYDRDKLADAEAAVRRAEQVVAGAGGGGGGGIEQLRARVRQWRIDLETVATLEEFRGSEGPITTKKPTGGHSAADLAYGDLLRQYGVDFEALEPAEVSRRLRASAVRRHFIAALDHWTAWDYAEQRKSPAYGRLLAVAKGLDPDPWRDRLRDALGVNDKRVLAELLRDKEAVSQPPSTVLLLWATARPWETAVPMLRGAQARHPGDFWLNYTLGQPVNHRALPMGQATGYARAAVALRPSHFDARWNLAVSLRYEDLPQAAVEFREALRIRPTNAYIYSALVGLHLEMGDKEGAAAIARDMDGAKMDEKDLLERANVYGGVGRWEDAINAYREALRLNPDERSARDLLIGALHHVSRPAELSDELREVLRRHPEYMWARTQLADALVEQGLVNEAIGEARECVRRAPTDFAAHACLAAALYRKGAIEEASEEYRQATEMYPYDGDPFSGLYDALLRDRRSAEACAAAEVLAAHGKSAGALYNSACHFGLALARAANDPEARERYAACAIKLLAAAESRKKFVRRVDVELLKRDPDLDALRRRPDFLALVARVEQTLAEAARPPLPRLSLPPGPYLGFPAPVPGVVQAEHYDEGGEGVAYHDIDEQPALRGPRPADSVHLDACLDQGGGFNVGSVFADEWLAYTVAVAGDAEYVLDFRVASPVGGGTLHVEFDGADKTGPVVIPKTGDWQAWQTVSSKPIRLKRGRQVMRLVFDTAGRSVWACNLNWIEVRASAAQGAGTGATTRPVSPLGIKAK